MEFNEIARRKSWFQVKSFVDAKAIVRSLQRSGADVFRGQVNNVLPRPRTHRHVEDELHVGIREQSKTECFIDALRVRMRIRGLDATEDEMIALAQHYGLQTPFLDVTLDPGVAFFFAKHGSNQRGRGVVFVSSRSKLGLENDDIERLKASMNDLGQCGQEQLKPIAKMVTVRSGFCTRLDAQRGAFLEFDDVEEVDRLWVSVVFDHSPEDKVERSIEEMFPPPVGEFDLAAGDALSGINQMFSASDD